MPATSGPSASRCVTDRPVGAGGLLDRHARGEASRRPGCSARDPRAGASMADPARAVVRARHRSCWPAARQRGHGRRDEHGPGGLQQFTAVHGRSRNAGNYGTIWPPMPRALLLAVPVALLSSPRRVAGASTSRTGRRPAPAEHRHRPGGRPRLRRPERLRPGAVSDAGARSTRGRRDPVHRVLRRAARSARRRARR